MVTIANLKDLSDKTTLTMAKTRNIQHSRIIDNVHYGSKYNVSVRTDAPGSISTPPVEVSGPPIPVPFGLTQHFSPVKGTEQVEQLIYWQRESNEHMPGYLKDAGYSYMVFMRSADSDMSHPELTFKSDGPPFDLSYVTEQGAVLPSQLYYLSVALVDGDGYMSQPSDPIPVETMLPREDIVVSKTSVLSVLIPTLALIILLGAGLAYYVHRNRRLTRSFQAFASRYNAASGAAILNQGPLDDDDDASPIIRGFSDDEPLVVT